MGDLLEHLAAIRGVRLGKRGGRRPKGANIPTVGELAKEVGVSESTAYRRLGGLDAYRKLTDVLLRDEGITFAELLDQLAREEAA